MSLDDPSQSPVDIAGSWRRFLLEEVATQNYWRTYLMYGLQSHRHAVLEQALPALLYIKAVTILDDALSSLVVLRGLKMPSRYPDSLGGRISFLADNEFIGDRDELHRIRERRNELAHETAARATWEELAADRGFLHRILLSLRLGTPTDETGVLL